jgi:hypothetical protein
LEKVRGTITLDVHQQALVQSRPGKVSTLQIGAAQDDTGEVHPAQVRAAQVCVGAVAERHQLATRRVLEFRFERGDLRGVVGEHRVNARDRALERRNCCLSGGEPALDRVEVGRDRADVRLDRLHQQQVGIEDVGDGIDFSLQFGDLRVGGVVSALVLERIDARVERFDERKVGIEDVGDCLDVLVQRGDVRAVLDYYRLFQAGAVVSIQAAGQRCCQEQQRQRQVCDAGHAWAVPGWFRVSLTPGWSRSVRRRSRWSGASMCR